jgi:hypothetical protein
MFRSVRPNLARLAAERAAERAHVSRRLQAPFQLAGALGCKATRGQAAKVGVS